MSVCPACSAPAAAHARFCGACGSPLPAGCPACGADTVPDQAFCTECGHALIGRHRSDERRRRGRGEERRVVTVLFVDVVGWTSAAEQLDPEDLRAAQSDYFAAVRQVIEQGGGTVEKYIGDAVLACFGAPRATEDDALRAVRSALRIQEVLRDLNVGDAPLEARAGVATAEALVDLDADPARGQAFVTGDVVNLASRLQSAAAAGGVLVSSATYLATRDAVDYVPVGPLALKGKTEPAPAYLARAVLTTAAQGPRHALPFVGRGPQLRLLESCLDRVIGDGAGALVSITGEPGIGKSRLVHELRASRAAASDPRSPALRWLTASCQSLERQGSYAPLGALLAAWVAELPGSTGAGLTERLAEALTAVAPPADAARLAAALTPLLPAEPGLDPGYASGQAAVGPDRQARSDAVDAWRRVMVALAEHSPTVLVLEDLHHADDALLDAVDELLALATEVPLLLIVTSWPELLERRPGWGAAGSDTVTLSLPPLDEDETVSLLRGQLGPALPPAALDRLVALAGGNPLYAGECAEMLAEQEPAQLEQGFPELPLPRSVRGLVASRLDLISPDEREVLHAASVLGDSCWPGPVGLLAGLPSAEVEVGLAQLARRGMLRRVRPSAVAGEPEYAFRSELVRQLVYARLPRTRRLLQHTRAADWWAARPSGTDPARTALVAHHRVIAAELAAALRSLEAPLRTGQARQALKEAAQHAYDVQVLLPTRAHLERAVGRWPRDLDPAGRLSAQRLAEEVRFLADREAFVAGGGQQRLAELATELQTLHAPAEAARAHTLLAEVATWASEPEEALRHTAAAAKLLDGLPSSEQRARTLTELARRQLAGLGARQAIRTGRAARALAEELGLAAVAADALAAIGAARYRSGDPGGISDQEAALELARREPPAPLARIARELAATLAQEGDLQRSYALLDAYTAAYTDAYTAADEAAGGRGGPAMASSLAAGTERVLRAYREGDWGLALSLADSALAVRPAGAADEPLLYGLQAWLHLLQGRPAGALLGELDAAVERGRRAPATPVAQPAAPHDSPAVAAALAFAARASALEGDLAGARTRYAELRRSLAGHSTAATGRLRLAAADWLPSAAAVAARLDEEGDPEPAQALRAELERAPRRTRWVRAALAGLESVRARRCADPERALAAAEQAVALYGDIGDETERGLAVAVAAARERELRGSGRWEWELAAFAARTGAVRLLTQTSPASQILGLVPQAVAEPSDD